MRNITLAIFLSGLLIAPAQAAEFEALPENYKAAVCVLCENPLSIHAGKLFALANHKLLVEQADQAARQESLPAELITLFVIVEQIHFANGKLGFDFLDLRTKQRRIGYVAVDSTGELRMIAEANLAASFAASRTVDGEPEGEREVTASKLRFEWLDQGKPSGKFLATATEPTAMPAIKHDPGALKFRLGSEKEAAEIVGYQYRSSK